MAVQFLLRLALLLVCGCCSTAATSMEVFVKKENEAMAIYSDDGS